MSRNEVWILGDFNTDLLKRGDIKTICLINFAKQNGLAHLVNDITRPHCRGGTCIDLIMSNCIFVQDHGVGKDMISDHFTVYAICKKGREDRRVFSEEVRDYKKCNSVVFGQLLEVSDWSIFDKEINPEIQWNIILEKVREILSIMCPVKKDILGL